jgi:hypothetical protein
VDSVGSGQGPVTISCEHGDKPSVFGMEVVKPSRHHVNRHSVFISTPQNFALVKQCVNTTHLLLNVS